MNGKKNTTSFDFFPWKTTVFHHPSGGSVQAVGAGYGNLLSPTGGSKDIRWMPPPEPEVGRMTGGWRAEIPPEKRNFGVFCSNQTWLVVWLPSILFSQKYWEFHHPNWLSYFWEGFKPPTRRDNHEGLNCLKMGNFSQEMYHRNWWFSGFCQTIDYLFSGFCQQKLGYIGKPNQRTWRWNRNQHFVIWPALRPWRKPAAIGCWRFQWRWS